MPQITDPSPLTPHAIDPIPPGSAPRLSIPITGLQRNAVSLAPTTTNPSPLTA
jgi:hypothetical protein